MKKLLIIGVASHEMDVVTYFTVMGPEDQRLYLFADENVRDEWVAGLPDGSLKRSENNWAKR